VSGAATAALKRRLDLLYRACNRREWVHPDPLEMVHRYDAAPDQEIAGIVAATLAYGRVAQILASVGRVLDVMEGRPRAFLASVDEAALRNRLAGFTHRFTTGAEMAALLAGIARALAEHGSLEALFLRGMGRGDATVLPGLARFVDQLRIYAGGPRACPSLLSSPEDGSACKRLNLYLRWMVRRDAVDPGPWEAVSAAKLVVPLDTHQFRIATRLGLTRRRQADLRTALEITRGYAQVRPRDPVRYDFSLTRLGINPACRDMDLDCVLKGS
jgi:uncharacterized protein (TIGR02757 family)